MTNNMNIMYTSMRVCARAHTHLSDRLLLVASS